MPVDYSLPPFQTFKFISRDVNSNNTKYSQMNILSDNVTKLQQKFTDNDQNSLQNNNKSYRRESFQTKSKLFANLKKSFDGEAKTVSKVEINNNGPKTDQRRTINVQSRKLSFDSKENLTKVKISNGKKSTVEESIITQSVKTEKELDFQSFQYFENDQEPFYCEPKIIEVGDVFKTKNDAILSCPRTNKPKSATIESRKLSLSKQASLDKGKLAKNKEINQNKRPKIVQEEIISKTNKSVTLSSPEKNKPTATTIESRKSSLNKQVSLDQGKPTKNKEGNQNKRSKTVKEEIVSKSNKSENFASPTKLRAKGTAIESRKSSLNKQVSLDEGKTTKNKEVNQNKRPTIVKEEILSKTNKSNNYASLTKPKPRSINIKGRKLSLDKDANLGKAKTGNDKEDLNQKENPLSPAKLKYLQSLKLFGGNLNDNEHFDLKYHTTSIENTNTLKQKVKEEMSKEQNKSNYSESVFLLKGNSKVWKSTNDLTKSFAMQRSKSSPNLLDSGSKNYQSSHFKQYFGSDDKNRTLIIIQNGIEIENADFLGGNLMMNGSSCEHSNQIDNLLTDSETKPKAEISGKTWMINGNLKERANSMHNLHFTSQQAPVAKISGKTWKINNKKIKQRSSSMHDLHFIAKGVPEEEISSVRDHEDGNLNIGKLNMRSTSLHNLHFISKDESSGPTSNTYREKISVNTDANRNIRNIGERYNTRVNSVKPFSPSKSREEPSWNSNGRLNKRSTSMHNLRLLSKATPPKSSARQPRPARRGSVQDIVTKFSADF